MRDAIAFILLASHGDIVDAISLFITSFACNNELIGAPLLFRKLDGDFIEHWSCERISRLSGAIGIETNHVKHCPCRHSTCIIVARNAVGSILKVCIEQAFNFLLGSPLFAFEV